MTIARGEWEDDGGPLQAGALPLVRFIGASSTRHVAESDGVITFTLALSAASAEVVTATLQASSYMSADMDTAPLVVTFAPGQTTATASLTLYNDTVYEADEVFAIDIISATNAAVDPAVEGALNVSRLLGVIDYNDVPTGPLVSFPHTTPTDHIAESGGAFNFTLLLSEASSLPVTATVQASSYRAGDMDTSARTFTFQPGQTSISGSIAIYDDAEYEPDEIFALDLVGATNAAVNLTTQSGRAASQLLGYIDNDDAPPSHMVRFINASGTQYFSEGAGVIPFTLQLSAPSTETVSVTIAPSSYMSADLNTVAQTIVFQPGQTTVTGQVVIYDDNFFEQDEVFAIDITSATNAVIDPSVEGALQVSRILGYLQDNDPPGPPPPDVAVVGPTSVGEGDGSFHISLRFPNVGVLSGTYSYGFDEGVSTATYADVSVPFKSGSFSVAQSPSGEYVIDLGSISIVDDALSEGAETVAITITVPGHTFSNGSSTYVHVVTLRDNDPILGTPNNDILTGGPENDVIRGLAGDDHISGLGGIDTLDGGPGVDTVSYAAATSGVKVHLGAPGYYAGDTLIDIENVIGTAYLDILTGNNGANVLEGGDGDDHLDGAGGNDILRGGAGADHITDSSGSNIIEGGDGNDDIHLGGSEDDTIDGGAGDDLVIYTWVSAGVTIDLGITTRQNTVGSGWDLLVNVENVWGTAFADVITGDGRANWLWGGDLSEGDVLNGAGGNDRVTGGQGNDLLNGGPGDDVLAGNSGVDTATYFDAVAGVAVSLAVATAQDTGGAGIDTLSGIENLTGSGFDDTLGGDAAANVLDGGIGSDILFGGAGADILRDGGETTNRDFLYGGAGNDTYYVSSSLAGPADLVYEGPAVAGAQSGANDVDMIHSAGDFFWDYYGVAETLYIDRTAGSQMVGGANSQTIFGNVGNDVILAYGGSNVIDGGAGTDAIGLGLYGLDESQDGVNTIVMKAGSGMDYIFDFESGVDKIDLTAFHFGITGAQVLAQAINVDNAGTANDYCYFYLTSAGGVDNFVVFMGLLSSQLQASDFIT